VDHLFGISAGVRLRIRVYPGPIDSPLILCFHGNMETARDFDPVGDTYRELPATLAVTDYRGYGPCGGNPSVLTFLDDAHATLDKLRAMFPTRTIVVMGRALGSAPAIELAANRPDEIRGLIVESGFALLVPLLKVVGVPTQPFGITEEHGPGNLEKMASVTVPTLLMHAENDEVIPIAEAEMLHEAGAAPDREFLRVPRAGHHDISLEAGDGYFEAIGRLLARVSR